ncbi:hypothetical protein C8R42DRAFT_646141 [Lentinula raphanica]|nr:hypothetical protein C8R42DRAFT_646141 [Lentinula raphanica]
MNHQKLNRLAKRNYHALGSDSDDNDYEPSQRLSPIAKKGRLAESTTIHLRPSFLAATEANKSISESCIFDEDVGSQQFLDKLCTTRGLDPLLLRLDKDEDSDSDIKNAEYAPESQKPELYGSSPEPSSPGEPLPMEYRINVEENGKVQIAKEGQTPSAFCPHFPSGCACANLLLKHYHQLQEHLSQEQQENEQLIAKNYRLNKRMHRLHRTLENALNLLESSHFQTQLEQPEAVRPMEAGKSSVLLS